MSSLLVLSLLSSLAQADDRIDHEDGTFSFASAYQYQGPTSITMGALSLDLVGPAI